MGTTVRFASNGDTAEGYLALPDSGSGPGVIVVQEWWGLVPQIKRVCDRLAAEGFVALAPDLYRGDIAEHTEMDKAAQLMTTLPMDRAARDMGGAVDFLLAHAAVTGDKVGVVGYCMGGMLTLVVAAQQGDKIGAAAPYYGAPLGDDPPDWSKLTAPVRGHFGGADDFFPPAGVQALEKELQGMGKDVVFEMHDGAGHAFTNDANVFGTYDEDLSAETWAKTVTFLHDTLWLNPGRGLVRRRAPAASRAGSRRGPASSCPLDVDRVARVALGPAVPRTGRDLARDAVAQVLLELADLGLAADRTVTGHDRVRELGDRVEHVGPHRAVALERERRDPEEAEVAREQHVDVRDERHDVAVGVAGRGQHLDAGVSSATSVTRWVTGRVPSSASSSNSLANAGMNDL